VEQRVLDGLLTNEGVLQAALLDKDGLPAFISPRHDDAADQLAQAVGPLDASQSNRVTIQGEHACVMAQHLKANRVLVLKCQTGANLGRIRTIFDQAITALDGLIV
tara:strand:- start:3340 stop:3657 length:318 start_codon:yes stop_codon:yes gene_type:complete